MKNTRHRKKPLAAEAIARLAEFKAILAAEILRHWTGIG